MDAAPIARFFGPSSRRLFGTYHAPRGPARAAVLVCPPLLHEHARSFRFFSQVATQLAGAGLACLRFDYLGTGDSAGEDSQFTPSGAAEDIRLASAELRRESGDAPLIVMGIRASSLFVVRDAAALGASALWLWQPVVDGRAYVEMLEARDLAERRSDRRYPLLKEPAPALADDLMGFRLSPAFRNEMRSYRLDARPAGLPLAVLAPSADPAGPVPGADLHIDLPATLCDWATEIDLDGLIPLRDARDPLESLIGRMERWGVHG